MNLPPIATSIHPYYDNEFLQDGLRLGMTFGFGSPTGNTTADGRTFAVFAKYWEPGQVKTRLARAVGASTAAEIYRLFLQISLGLVAGWPGRKVLGFSPPARAAEFAELASDWERIPQVQADLGTRMKKFFEQVLGSSSELASKPIGQAASPSQSTESSQLAILIGSDTPLLTRPQIERAFSELASHDVVVGPSEDGGYYLIGARNQTPEIFDNIDWSTPRVFEQTIQRLNQLGCSFAVLPTGRDVDDLADLRWLAEQLAEPTLGDRPEFQRLSKLCRIAIQHADSGLPHADDRSQQSQGRNIT